MKPRDWEYVENRLVGAPSETLEAIERLRLVGEHQAADQLMAAAKVFADQRRAVRYALADKQHRSA